MIHQINDKVIMWEDLSAILSISPILAPHFNKEVVIPILIGSLNTQGVPLFTLKFALFILTKLVKTLSNFKLLNYFGDLLFSNVEVNYSDAQLGTASLRPFDLKTLGEDSKDS